MQSKELIRECFYCKQEKILDDFVRAPRSESQFGYFCTECMGWMKQNLTAKQINILRTYAFRKYNPSAKRQTKITNLKMTLKKFGMTLLDYEAQLILQDNLCPICELPFTDNNGPIIEHCHTTNTFRGLTHQSCNLFIAAIENNQNIQMNRVYAYLKQRKGDLYYSNGDEIL